MLKLNWKYMPYVVVVCSLVGFSLLALSFEPYTPFSFDLVGGHIVLFSGGSGSVVSRNTSVNLSLNSDPCVVGVNISASLYLVGSDGSSVLLNHVLYRNLEVYISVNGSSPVFLGDLRDGYVNSSDSRVFPIASSGLVVFTWVFIIPEGFLESDVFSLVGSISFGG